MAYFSIPYKSNGTNTFFNFYIEHDCVLFAGSRHLSINKQVCDGLITQLGKLGLTFIVGCCRGVDESFRLALSLSDYAKKTFVACAFKDRVGRFGDLSSSLVVSPTSSPRTALHQRTIFMVKHCSMAVIFADNPLNNRWGKGSSLAIRSCIKYGKPVFVITNNPPEDSNDYRIFPSSLFGVVKGYWIIPTSIKEAASWKN